MKREYLKGLGLEEDVIDKIMAEHGNTVNTTKQALSTAEADRDTYKKELDQRATQLENLKKESPDNEQLQATIDKLEKDNEDFQEKLKTQQFNYELEKSLVSANARNPKAVMGLLDTATVKLDDEGKIMGLHEQLEKLKETDGYMFKDPEEANQQQQANNQSNQQQTPPSHTPGGNQRHNNPGDVDPREAGRQKALERFGLNKEEK